MYRIIQKKMRGEILTKNEIEYVVNGFTDGTIPDYQMSALLMAICLRGMTGEETFDLTMAMAYSGDMLDLSSVCGVKADKHSTGGVGDKTTLVVGPIAAANGVKIAKMSGRGLGHTGGTIDKLEAIPGFQTSLTNEQFIENVNKTGISIISQSMELAPADKKIYALRDVTATVDSIPLIASSIMSKKLAAGSDVIVLDVKTGSGAFMKNKEDAILLAERMINIGLSAGKKMYALISDMNQPLGRFVGNRLEVLEALDTLKGKGPDDFCEDCYYLSALILLGAGAVRDISSGIMAAKQSIYDGSALDKFKSLVLAQGGEVSFIDEPSGCMAYRKEVPVRSEKSGYVSEIDTEAIGLASMYLGGGREKKDDIIDFNVGIEINFKPGDYVEKGDALATLYVNSEERLEQAYSAVFKAYTIDDKPQSLGKGHIYGYFEGRKYIDLMA